jgi:hypothetical protein
MTMPNIVVAKSPTAIKKTSHLKGTDDGCASLSTNFWSVCTAERDLMIAGGT